MTASPEVSGRMQRDDTAMGAVERLRTWARQHRDACLRAARDLWRKPLDAALTAVVLGIAIALPLGLFAILNTVETATEAWLDRHEVTVFLDTDVQPDDADTLARQWQRLPGVTGTRLITPQQAMGDLKELLGLVELETVANDPLLPYLVVVELDRARANPTELVERLSTWKRVSQVQFDQDWLTKVDALVRLAKRTALVLTILLAIGALVVVGNTVRLGVERHREETEVLSLLGATSAFVRRPFLYQGCWHGLIGGLVGYLLVCALIAWLAEPFSELATLWATDVTLKWPSWTAALATVVLSAALATISARISVRPHLIPQGA